MKRHPDTRGEAGQATTDDRAETLIRGLELEPHPEGGHYREIFRSQHAVQPQDGRELRSALTSIYYLLREGERSRWHRVASDEAWHFYEGDAVELWVAAPDGSAFTRVSLGPGGADSAPTYVVPARWWQAARPRGGYALTGCTVGPGFDVRDFVLLGDDPDSLELLRGLWPAIEEML